jgi:hypothetical protein
MVVMPPSALASGKRLHHWIDFCTSRVCGSVVDIVRLLLPTYGDLVAFTHQEIWQDMTTQ